MCLSRRKGGSDLSSWDEKFGEACVREFFFFF